MAWSNQQEIAIKAVGDWIRNPNSQQVFKVFGYAGTGKTTIAKEMAKSVKGIVLYATFTGKAALVLSGKGCSPCSTIHSLIYKCKTDERTGIRRFELNKDSHLSEASLLIVDEVSMVGTALATDLLKFGVKILVLGDPAQLPAVKDESFFIHGQPDVMLTEVHRQAKDNPIIRMSMDVRNGDRLQAGSYGESIVLSRKDVDKDALGEMILSADQVICGLNNSRTNYNARIRALKGLIGDKKPYHPTLGDKIICWKNDNQSGVFNGSVWTVDHVKAKNGLLTIEMLSNDCENKEGYTAKVFEQFFNDTDKDLDWKIKRGTNEFKFGHAITAHKSQGSQWDDIVIFDESWAFREDRDKWLYTAITRAARKVTVVV